MIFINPVVIRSGGDAAAYADGQRGKLRAMDLHAPRHEMRLDTVLTRHSVDRPDYNVRPAFL